MRIGVFGIGNVLTGDDAFGPTVIHTLEAGYAFGPEVDLRDCGTPGLGFSNDVVDLDSLIVIDTVKTPGTPGDIHLFDRQAIVETRPTPRLSPHDPSLRSALLSCDLLGRGPQKVVLVGAVPENLETGIGLSKPIEDAVPRAVRIVLETLHSLGVAPIEQTAPPENAFFWSKA